MATEETKIIRIEIDQSVIANSKKRAIELSDSIAKLRGELKANTRETDDMNEAYIEQTAQLKALDKEYRQNVEVLKQANTITNTSEGSNNKLRAQLSLLTTQYNGLSKAERENSDVGQRLKSNIKEISDELKKNESAIGDNRRNVGNYKEAFSSLAGVLGNAGGALGGAANAAMGLNTAFKANPFIAVLSILIPLIQQFLKLDSVAEKIESVMNSVNAAFKVTIGAIGDFIGAVVGGKPILDAFSDSFDDLGGRISKAAEETYALTQATKTLEDARRAQIVLNAQDEAAVKRLLIQSKDRTKSIEERLMLLFKATQIEKNNLEEQQKIAKEEERIAKQKLALADKNADNIDELRQEAADASAKAIQLESQSLDLQEKIENRRNALLQEREDAQAKAAEAQQKRTEAEVQAAEKAAKQKEELDKKENERLAQQELKKAEALNAARIAEQEAGLISFNALQERIEKEAEIKKNQATIEITDEQIKAATIQEIDRMLLESKLANLQAYIAATGVATQEQIVQETALQAQLVELDRITNEKKRTEAKKTEQFTVGSAQQSFGVLSSIAGNLGSLAEEGSQSAKDAAVAQAIINTFASAIAAYQSAASIPVAGFVLGPIAAAAALAAGLANVSKIKSVKAARGTFLNDGQGTETSDSIPAMLSRNETVINAKSSKQFLPLLSRINEWGGGVSFVGASRGANVSDTLVSRFANGGVASFTNQAFQAQEQSQQVANTINQIVPVLVIEEFQNVQGRQIRTESNLQL